MTSKNPAAIDPVTEQEDEIDPINDIIDYLVRAANISFKNAHVDEAEIRTSDKIRMATNLYNNSPTDFLMQFGKYLAPYHIEYFEKMSQNPSGTQSFRQCIQHLKSYHSEASRHKRIRNRRYKALQQLQNESDYFSEKQMMQRNPLLYEQLVGQYMTDEEIKERDGTDSNNLTLLSMILDTVDRNNMTQTKNEQLLEEGLEAVNINGVEQKQETESKKQWGEFDTPDPVPSFKPEKRKQNMVSAPERRLFRQEFYQEMYSSFIEGHDDFDYSTVDNNEQYDDLQQVSQDEEDKYFDSETNDIENLEQHMKLVQEYGRRNSNNSVGDDPLDVFMDHLSNKLKT